MISDSATIKNKHGIHVRPSRVISDDLSSYEGQIMFTANDICINTMNMINILCLGLKEGDVVDITLEGPEEEHMLQRIIELLEREYDFPDAGN